MRSSRHRYLPPRAVLASFAGALAAGILSASPCAAAESKAAKEFLAVARENFNAWDYQHKGTLTREELEVDMQKPQFKGDSAVALAALKWGMQTKETKTPEETYWTEGVTLADFDAVEKALDEHGKIDNAPFNNSLRHFTAGRDKLAKESRALFASAGTPHLAAIRQTWDSDCYFNSGVGAIALERPQAVANLIKSNPDGSYTVTFPGKKPEIVPAPTDAEIAAYTDANDGVWFNVLEKAYALTRDIKPSDATAEPLDKAAQHGGSPGQIMKLISGHDVKSSRFQKQNGQLDEKQVAETRADLTAAFRDHRGVTAGAHHHAYVVAAYDPRTDTVTIHNPWDQNGPEVLTNGEFGVTFSGYTSMPTEKFVENFIAMEVEQPTPAK